MPKSTPRNPYRFASHVPGLRAATLPEALAALEDRFGRGVEEELADGLAAVLFEDEERHARVYRDVGSGQLIGIRSGPARIIQAFFRACSGPAGRLTGTGSATGAVVFTQLLHQEALGKALANWALLYAAVPSPCAAPCLYLPLHQPALSNLGYTVNSRILGVPWGITVTVDVTAQMWCV